MAKRDMVILHDFLESSGELMAILRQHDFVTKFCTFSRDDSSSKNLINPIIFAQLEGDVNTTQQRVTDIVQKKHLHQFPLIVVGPGVDQFSTLISHFFKLSLLVPSPFTEYDILDAIQQIQTLQEVGDTLTESESPGSEHHFTDVFSETHNFAEIQKRDLGGKLYMRASLPVDIADKSYLPDDGAVLEIIDDIAQQADKWDIGHFHRTALVAFNIMKALNVSPRKMESAKTAAFLYVWSMFQDQRLTRTDLARGAIDGIRERLQQKLRESSSRIFDELNLLETAEIVGVLARIVGEENIDAGDENFLVASCIFAADLMDRACWQSGSWDPGSAHRVLTRCKIGEIKSLPPQVMSCILKMMLEAVEATLPRRMMPRSVSSNSTLLEQAALNQQSKLGEKERRIALSALAPGMKLKRPLVTFDGKTIIPQDIVLDADIIWRLWSLSAVKALNTPLVVEAE